MTYIVVRNGQIAGPELATLPHAAQRLDTGAWVTPPNGQWSPADLTACGVFEVAPSPRPADTATQTSDRSLTVTAGKPVETWTPRAWTQAELDARAAHTSSVAKAVADRAILDATAALAGAGHTAGAAWVQPTGAHDAYAKGAQVTHNAQRWVSDIDANVWAPGVHGWKTAP